MAIVKGIEVGGETYDIADETSREEITQQSENIGNIEDLETEDKTNLVAAINELVGGGGGGLPLLLKKIDVTQFFTITETMQLSIGNSPTISFYSDGTFSVNINGEYFTAPGDYAYYRLANISLSNASGLFNAIKAFMGDSYSLLLGSARMNNRDWEMNGDGTNLSLRYGNVYFSVTFGEDSISISTTGYWVGECIVRGGGSGTVALAGDHRMRMY